MWQHDVSVCKDNGNYKLLFQEEKWCMFSILDIFKVFDKAYHPGLIFKRNQLGTIENILDMIES